MGLYYHLRVIQNSRYVVYKYISLDCEYNKSSEPKMNVVCLSTYNNVAFESFWTHHGQNRKDVIEYFDALDENHVILSFAAEAEASSLISLGIDPLRFKWIDLQLEVRMLYNHNYKLTLGKHLIDGREVTLRMFGEKPKTSLASSLYKFLGVKIDTEHKTKMRDLIISEDSDAIESEKVNIVNYCESDTKYLPQLFEKIKEWQKKCIKPKNLVKIHEEMLLRGEYSVRTAIMSRLGMPINMEWAYNLAANVPMALNECIQDINSQFPEIAPFRFDPKTFSYVMNTKNIKEWIEAQKFKGWKLTDGGKSGKKQLSLALDAWEDFFQFRHDFPRNNFGAQMLRYYKLKESLGSFNFKEGQKTKTFFDTCGSDGRSRPYQNHFGAQSSRTQQKSSGFLFLKSAFMRVLCQPPKGKAMGIIDYSSQEFLLSAVCSQDPKMIQAYREGDVYLYYGKGIGMIPPEGTKKTHGAERDLCKSTVLGLSYLMTKVGLSKKLTADTGKIVTEAQADDLVIKFDRLFNVFSRWREGIISFYKTTGYIRLADGWHMFGDNPNDRSTANIPLQGAGAVIMRKAVSLAQDKGLDVNFTLHDAIAVIADDDKILDHLDILGVCMREAFCFYFEGKSKEDASLIRLDYKAWGEMFDENAEITSKSGNKIMCSKLYIDPRSEKEYRQFSKYFMTNPSLELL